MSKKKQMIISLQNILVTEIPDSEATPGIRQADQDFGQIDIEGQRPAVAFPWAGIDLSEITYQQLQLRQQKATVRITVRIAFDPWGQSSSLQPESVREKALGYYDIEDKVYLSLQENKIEMSPGVYILITSLRRISESTEPRKDVLRVRKMVYEASWIDNSLNT